MGGEQGLLAAKAERVQDWRAMSDERGGVGHAWDERGEGQAARETRHP